MADISEQRAEYIKEVRKLGTDVLISELRNPNHDAETYRVGNGRSTRKVAVCEYCDAGALKR